MFIAPEAGLLCLFSTDQSWSGSIDYSKHILCSTANTSIMGNTMSSVFIPYIGDLTGKQGIASFDFGKTTVPKLYFGYFSILSSCTIISQCFNFVFFRFSLRLGLL